MKRTIDEIYELIIEKRDSAISAKNREPEKIVRERLYGEVDAYTDVLILIETSQILKEDNE
jgi:hypothetical protein